MDAFEKRYGVTVAEVEAALEENRRLVVRRLAEWGYAWAVEEIMCDVAEELLRGGLRRWAAYAERKPLGAFVNSLLGDRLGEWMRSERPKYRGGMTHVPRVPRQDPADPPSSDGPLDAATARKSLRRGDDAAGMSRLCEEADIFGDADSDIQSAPAGDRASYDAWLSAEAGTDRQDVLRSDAYRADMEWLYTKVIQKYPATAWTALLNQCLTARGNYERLCKEIRVILENHHRGIDPDLADYPYMSRALARHRHR